MWRVMLCLVESLRRGCVWCRRRPDGVAQPAGVVLQRGGGGRRGRRGAVRVRPVAPALLRLRTRGAPPRRRVPRGRPGAPQHGGGGGLRAAAAAPRLSARAVQAGGVGRTAPRGAPPRPRRVLALLLSRSTRSVCTAPIVLKQLGLPSRRNTRYIIALCSYCRIMASVIAEKWTLIMPMS